MRGIRKHLTTNLQNILLFLLVVNIQHTHARTIFASTLTKSDTDGSQEYPYTIKEAFNQAQNGRISEIVLLDGIYYLSNPIKLSLERTKNTPLSIRAKNPGKATLSGGTLLENPQIDERGRYVFEDVSLNNSRDLFIGKKRAVRARSLEYTYNGSRFSAIPGLKRRDRKEPGSSILIEPGFELLDHTGETLDIRYWKDIGGVEFVFRCAWWEKRCGIESIIGNEISPIEPAWTSINSIWSDERSSRLNATMPKRTHIEGAIELLDSPGEWHQNENTVYLFPLNQENKDETIILAQLENLLTLENSSYISITGINFNHTTWDLPLSTHGFNEGQANVVQQGEEVRVPSALTIKGSSNITIDSCGFENLGACGIEIVEASRSTDLRNCTFVDIGATPIRVGSTDPHVALNSKLQCKDISIKGNLINDSGSVYYGSTGIFVGYASNVDASFNKLDHLPYTGISFGWGWNSLNDKPVKISGNRITNNYIHDYLNEMYDGGGIYTLGKQGENFKTGLLISRNIVTNQGGLGNVIYSDGGSSWISIKENTTSNNLSELDLFYEGKGRYIPDWGGCNPVGNLFFHSNTLGNAQNKTPNFRCSPRDPAPWSRNSFIPPNTIISENRYQKNQIQKSKRYHNSNSKKNGSFALIFNSPTTEISVKAHKTTTLYVSPSRTDQYVDKIRETNQTIITSGENHLTLKSPHKDGKGEWKVYFSVSDIAHISSSSYNTTIELRENPLFHLFFYSDAKEDTGSIELQSFHKSLIRSEESWTRNPYSWQDLRSIVDLELPLSANARTIKTKLPPGRFTLRSNSKMNFISITE